MRKAAILHAIADPNVCVNLSRNLYRTLPACLKPRATEAEYAQ